MCSYQCNVGTAHRSVADTQQNYALTASLPEACIVFLAYNGPGCCRELVSDTTAKSLGKFMRNRIQHVQSFSGLSQCYHKLPFATAASIKSRRPTQVRHIRWGGSGTPGGGRGGETPGGVWGRSPQLNKGPGGCSRPD